MQHYEVKDWKLKLFTRPTWFYQKTTISQKNKFLFKREITITRYYNVIATCFYIPKQLNFIHHVDHKQQQGSAHAQVPYQQMIAQL